MNSLLRRRLGVRNLGITTALLLGCAFGCSADDDPSAPASGGNAATTGSVSGGAAGSTASGGNGGPSTATGGFTATGGTSTGGAPASGTGGARAGGSGLGGAPLVGAAGGSAGSSQGGGPGGAGRAGGASTDAGKAGGGAGGASSGGKGGDTGTSGGGGSAGRGGMPNAGGGGGGGGAGGASGKTCPFSGSVSYTLSRASSPSAAQSMAYDKITQAMDKALGYYNCYTDITKALRVSYEPSVATADGNVNGSIRFGSSDSMNYITAMHEIGHTVGVGGAEFNRLIRDGVFTGPIATAKLREIDGDPTAELHGDTQHFWPYGLNYTNEVKSEADLLNHCAIVVAMREDMGL